VFGTLVGLTPSGVRSRVETSAERHGAQVYRTGSYSPWLAPLPRWSATSTAVFHSISRDSYLSDLCWLQPLSEFVSRVDKVSTGESEEPLNYDVYGWWDWRRHTFSLKERALAQTVGVEWLRRSDKPDRFRVLLDGREFWSTVSRNWSLLVAYSLAGQPPFAIASSGELVRAVQGHVYLPLPLGRALAVCGRATPGPSPSLGPSGYSYSFPSAAECRKALSLLWGGDGPSDLDDRVRWLLSVASRREFAPNQVRVPIPPALLAHLRRSGRGADALLRARIPAGLIPHLERALHTRNR
jgi:hypothetical protein